MSSPGPPPDQLLPADPGTRDIARRIHASVQDQPIISPHGHVPVEWLAQDMPFADPTSPLLSPDHYALRMLHAAGVPLADLFGVTERLSEQTADTSYDRIAEVIAGDYAGYLRALAARRRYFVEHGALSSDHSHRDVLTLTPPRRRGEPHLRGGPEREGHRRGDHGPAASHAGPDGADGH